MEALKKIINIIFKILKWFLIIVIALVFLLGVIEIVADNFFDNAAAKDSCADSGGAWDYKRDACEFGPDDPRSKK